MSISQGNYNKKDFSFYKIKGSSIKPQFKNQSSWNMTWKFSILLYPSQTRFWGVRYSRVSSKYLSNEKDKNIDDLVMILTPVHFCKFKVCKNALILYRSYLTCLWPENMYWPWPSFGQLLKFILRIHWKYCI